MKSFDIATVEGAKMTDEVEKLYDEFLEYAKSNEKYDNEFAKRSGFYVFQFQAIRKAMKSFDELVALHNERVAVIGDEITELNLYLTNHFIAVFLSFPNPAGGDFVYSREGVENKFEIMRDNAERRMLNLIDIRLIKKFEKNDV